MKALVNHDGIIQYKWIIKDTKQLTEYIITIFNRIIAERTRKWMYDPKSDNQINQLYHIYKVGVLQLNVKIIAEVWENCQKSILKRDVLVFNEVGSYCTWNDEEMKIIDW